MFQSAFDLLSQPPEAYLIVFAIALGDGVFPLFPSESVVIVAGLLSVVGDLSLGWVILAGALGAFAGDNISYALGRFVGRPAQERFLNGERSQRALAWARGQLARARWPRRHRRPLRAGRPHGRDVHGRRDALLVPALRRATT